VIERNGSDAKVLANIFANDGT
jgi:hypothetical protein